MNSDALYSLIVVGLWVFGLVVLRRRLSDDEFRLAQFSSIAHIVGVISQVWITREVYGIGDMLTYWREGQLVAKALHDNFGGMAPEVLKLIFQKSDVLLPFSVIGTGSSTGSMTGITSLLMYVLDGSLYAGCFVVSFASFAARLWLFLRIRPRFAQALSLRLFIALMLIPSVVFWSSAMLKESIAITGLALLIVAVCALEERQYLTAVLVGLVGGVLVALLKPYILFPFAMGASLWIYAGRAAHRGVPLAVKPAYVIFGAAVAVGGILALGQLFPQYALDRLASGAASLQSVGTEVEGGSSYTLVADPTPSLGSQLVYAPLALLTALFRPTILEVRNVPMAVNAIETTVFLVLILRVLLSRRMRTTVSDILKSPVLLFCVAFVLTFGVAVGLASTNLGTLSRYRMPLVPFFALLVLTAGLRVSQPSDVMKPHTPMGRS